MKRLIPALSAILVTFIMALSWLAPWKGAKTNSNLPPEVSSSSITSSHLSDLPVADTEQAVKQTSGHRSTLMDTAIIKVADETIQRLEPSVQQLFADWGLTQNNVEQTLDLIHQKMVRSSREASRFDANSESASADLTPKLTKVSMETEADLLAIVGTVERLFQLNRVITDVNTNYYLATAADRDRQSKDADLFMKRQMTELKDRLGPDYEKILREKYGDATAEAMLRLDQDPKK